MMLNQLDADYRSFFALRRNGDFNAKPPNFKSRKYFTTMTYNQSGFKMERGCVKLSHKHPSGVPVPIGVGGSLAGSPTRKRVVVHTFPIL